jgi:hypothetical protein
MSEPKFHHYVPRFYLARFVDTTGFLWVFDKMSGRVFQTSPNKIAGQNKFYNLSELQRSDVDPLILEKQFAEIESEVSMITDCWLRQVNESKVVDIPPVNREIISLFLVLQMLRTLEARTQLVQFIKATQREPQAYDPVKDAQNLHIEQIWNEQLVNQMAKRVGECIWIFAKNDTQNPFCTSDHPVLIKSGDSKQWILGPRVFDQGMYIVFPLSPKLILYCMDLSLSKNLSKYDCSLSPVTFTSDMVDHENSGQIGMSYRFVFANMPAFEFAKMFCDLHPDIKNPERERYEHPSNNIKGGLTSNSS